MSPLVYLQQLASYPLLEIASPGQKGWIGYVGGAVAVAALAHSPKKMRTGLGDALRALFPRQTWLQPSVWADVKIWLTNAAILLVAGPIFAAVSANAFGFTLGALRNAFSMQSLCVPSPLMGTFVKTLVDLVMLDLGLFLAHFAQHKVPALWLFHKVHHSAEILTPVTVFRMHPVDVALNMSSTGVLTGIGAAVCAFLFAGHGDLLRIHSLNVLEAAFLLAGYHLRHSHVWVMFPGWIGRHISSPALHLVHHSRDKRHWDKNLGQIFTTWDRIAGTLYLPTEREEVAFGIGFNGEEANYHSLAGLYLTPIRDLFRRSRTMSATQRRLSQSNLSRET